MADNLRPERKLNPPDCGRVLKALADRSRWRIVQELLTGPCGMQDLQSRLGIAQYNLSKQIGILKDAGIVTAQRAGKTVTCALERRWLADLAEEGRKLDFGCCSFRFSEMESGMKKD